MVVAIGVSTSGVQGFVLVFGERIGAVRGVPIGAVVRCVVAIGQLIFRVVLSPFRFVFGGVRRYFAKVGDKTYSCSVVIARRV